MPGGDELMGDMAVVSNCNCDAKLSCGADLREICRTRNLQRAYCAAREQPKMSMAKFYDAEGSAETRGKWMTSIESSLRSLG